MKRFLLLLLIAAPLFAQKRAFTLEDVYRVRTVGALSLSPDGRSVLYTLSATDLPHAKRTTHIWMMDADGGNARELTHGDGDSSPAFSPDGKTIAFVRGGNLYLLPLAGGEARQPTTISTGVSDPLWSPDGKSIAFASDVYPECSADDACNEKVADRWSKGKLQAHMADSLLYRHWTEWRHGKAPHTLLVDVDKGAVRDLTPGRFDFPGFELGGPLQYAFSPDSGELAVASNHDPEPASSTNTDLWLIDLKTPNAAPRNITAANHGYDNSPQYSPDGRFIAYRTQSTPAYESAPFPPPRFYPASGAAPPAPRSRRRRTSRRSSGSRFTTGRAARRASSPGHSTTGSTTSTGAATGSRSSSPARSRDTTRSTASTSPAARSRSSSTIRRSTRSRSRRTAAIFSTSTAPSASRRRSTAPRSRAARRRARSSRT